MTDKKPTKRRKSNAGRPRIVVDREEVEKLCAIHCTKTEIARWFRVSEDTIERRVKAWGYENFAEFFKKYSAAGKASLRRAQWVKAVEDKNTTMMIWLGKQLLGQSDKIDHSGNDVEITLNYQPRSQRESSK